MPGFTITSFVPEVVDGLFKALDDTSSSVHDTTIAVLTELLHCLDPDEGGGSVSNNITTIIMIRRGCFRYLQLQSSISWSVMSIANQPLLEKSLLFG